MSPELASMYEKLADRIKAELPPGRHRAMALVDLQQSRVMAERAALNAAQGGRTADEYEVWVKA